MKNFSLFGRFSKNNLRTDFWLAVEELLEDSFWLVFYITVALVIRFSTVLAIRWNTWSQLPCCFCLNSFIVGYEGLKRIQFFLRDHA